MIPANPKQQLSSKELIEKIIKLKPEFDRLTDYNSKLKFWDKNGFDISVRTYGITDEKDKRDLPENNISIYPENAGEIKAYKKFYHELFHIYNFNTLDTAIDKYWRKIEQGANPIPHTENIIAEIDKEYITNNKFKDTGLNSLRSYCNGYDASENGQIEDFLNSSSFHNSLHQFFTGEVHEKYRRFLVKQLKQLKSGKPAMFDAQEKLHISIRLLGENKSDMSQLDYYHIPYILNYFDITPKEAREILLFSKGAFSPEMNVQIVEKIVEHLEKVYPGILIDNLQTNETDEYQPIYNWVINPTHNFELLKPVRLEQFEQKKQDFITERKEKNLLTADFELNSFYIFWLENEIKVTEQWLSDTHPKGEKKKNKPSASTQIEIKKYKNFIIKEIEKTENIITAGSKGKLASLQQKRQTKKGNSFSLKQIAIAYAVMNITITKENAESILKKHSTFKSTDKLIQKRVIKTSELTLLSANKTADTKHLTDLKEAERLISGTKNKNAKMDMKRIITAFTNNYNNKY